MDSSPLPTLGFQAVDAMHLAPQAMFACLGRDVPGRYTSSLRDICSHGYVVHISSPQCWLGKYKYLVVELPI